MNVGENPVVTQSISSQGLCEAENLSTEGPQDPDEPDRSHGRWRAAMRAQSGFHEALEIGKHVPNQTTGHSLVSIPKTEQCRVVFSCNLVQGSSLHGPRKRGSFHALRGVVASGAI